MKAEIKEFKKGMQCACEKVKLIILNTSNL